MDQITIDIPEGLPNEQRDELVRWLAKEAAAAIPKRSDFEGDPDWQAETARRIKVGIDAADADHVMTSAQARRRHDTKLGIDRGL